ncbi:hypothetical protein A2685_02475 [Candidatus Woesebacteria bacterium RIFCSPHIGHO2_01_FULL_37_10]|uniref:Uncharacterized protein n=1 Tax=Candidatus Woesebacteria bacterium RIFCSPHIGHO2_01_FULL_37_10 TaxID=1802489 RepID=A0A1F7XUK3_9BACT|nr:MAG: hypothetical protein A2685_02475 [Candidatus Woesebacteria bacterium RIFCSPHIGHO2_01_FULL_37_10]
MEIIQQLVAEPLFIVKLCILLFLLLYIIFAFIVSKQIKIMLETLDVGFEKPIKLIASFHLILSFLVFVLAFFIL